MSQKHSSTPPRQSPAAAAEPPFSASEQAVYQVGAIAAAFGFFGVIWLDAELVVLDSYGWLVDTVERGRPVTDSLVALVGLENEILALKERPDQVVELPAVAVADADRPARKLNFTFFWNNAEQCHMALAYRSPSQTELEMELSKQIRARLIAEAEVTAKSKELVRANADLESFASIISHDLKAPLRHMRYLAESRGTDAGASDAGTLHQKLREVEMQAKRMTKMLTELFDYSSLGRKYEAVAAVDTRAMIEAIRATYSDDRFAIEVSGAWPTIMTLGAPLDLVLRNLIGNAIQHQDRPVGRILASCTDEPLTLKFVIDDDGPGIDARDHESIFLPFRTLDPAAIAQSTGMGLAMVKKAVEGAGGSISVASKPQQKRGTAFTVVWPKHISA